MADKSLSQEPLREFDWDEVVPLILKAKGIRSGLWSFGLRFNLAAINAGSEAGQVFPTALAAVRGVSLRRVEQAGPLVFDAATMKRVAIGNLGAADGAPPTGKAKSARVPAKKTRRTR